MNNIVQLTDNTPNENQLLFESEDLFDRKDAWIETPDLAFVSWSKKLSWSDSTRIVRLSMWRKFLRYLSLVGTKLDQCSEAQITGFITHAGLEKEQGWRYVKLLENVFVHLNLIGIETFNPARDAGKKGVGTRPNDPKRFLTHDETERLMQYFADVAQFGRFAWESNKKTPMEKNEFIAAWLLMRDAAVCSVLLGAGVTVSELVRLSVNCTSEMGELKIPKFRFVPERTVKLLPGTEDVLRAWLLFHDRQIGQVLFPAFISRRRDDQRKITAAMHPSSVFRRTQRILEGLGITDARACGQTLRNTYAAWLIDSEFDNENIIEAMGYKKGAYSIQRLRHDHALFFKKLSMDRAVECPLIAHC